MDAKIPRVGWDQYFCQIAAVAASRSTCDRAKVGAVVVSSHRTILATGYNGSVRGEPHCNDIGHLMEEGHCIRTVHAEANAIAQAAMHGARLHESMIYSTHSPCWPCTKLIVNAGIWRVVFAEPYRPDPKIQDLLRRNPHLHFEQLGQSGAEHL